MSCMQAAAVNTNTPIVVVLIHGGPLDVSWLEKSDRIGAIMSAWYPGQVSLCYHYGKKTEQLATRSELGAQIIVSRLVGFGS